jgi:topoisomerase IV subunit A
MAKKSLTPPTQTNTDDAREDINTVNVATYAQQAYLDYAMSVVCGRAIPYLEDGQKPVQRRTLFCMSDMRLLPEGKPVKSAKIIGTVLGSYHPHGDQSVYDAMVRQTQNFVMRYPLVHGEGNFGSRDGDGAAAMRYCFTGDTLVTTERGLERISDIVGDNEIRDGVAPLDLQVSSLDGLQRASKWLFSGFHRTLTIKTKLGFTVQSTPNEPFYVIDPDDANGFAWKRADALQSFESVYLKLDSLSQLKISSTALPPELAHFFGPTKTSDFYRFLAFLWTSGTIENASHGHIRFNLSDVRAAHLLDTISRMHHIQSTNRIVMNYETPIGSFQSTTIDTFTSGLLSALTLHGCLGMKHLPPVFLHGSHDNFDAFFHVVCNPCVRSVCLIATDPDSHPHVISELLTVGLATGRLLNIDSQGGVSTQDAQNHRSTRNPAYIFDTIESITFSDDLHPVYDLTVENTHAFVANGFIAHNTEAKLSTFSNFLLRDLNSDTVDFRPNYDGTTEEPELLPARLPFILMNGAEGVGVGMACSIPPHKASEVTRAAITLLKNPKATFEDVMEHIPGPDFPTGGQLIQSREKILAAYKDGNGTLKLRGRFDIETAARGAWKLVIRELPYGTSPKKIMEQVDALFNPKPKDKGAKKEFSAEQLRLKQLFSGMVDVYRDESGKEQAVRVVFEPKSSKQNPQDLVDALLAYTTFQDTIKLNFVMVGRDRRPACKGVLTVLREWNEFRVEVTRRRLQHELAAAERRLHIVEGRLKIMNAIQEAIAVIQSSDDAKDALMQRFGLSEAQAIDVLEMRLRQLARLEGSALDKEKVDLGKTIARLARLLSKTNELVALVIDEIESDLKLLGDDPRTTLVETVADADEPTSAKSKAISMSPEEDVTVAVSDKFWVRAKAGHDQPADGFTFKTGDTASRLFNTTTRQTLFTLDHSGRVYSMDVSEVPSGRGGDGLPLSSAWDVQGKILDAWAGKAEDRFILVSELGHGFMVTGADLQTRMKAGKVALVVAEGVAPLSIVRIPALLDENAHVVCDSSDGSIVAFPLSELPVMGKGKGVGFMGLRDGCKVRSVVVTSSRSFHLLENGKSTLVQGDTFDSVAGARSSGKKGRKLAKTSLAVLQP